MRFKKSGIVFYFDIFNFQEIIDILREKYGIPATYEEVSITDKFTFAIYFDNQLNFIAEKLFFTISGYIRYKRELPEDFLKAERDLRDDLSKKFEDLDFNTVLEKLLKQYGVILEDCRYGFVKDLENSDVNLHSFFIDDLEKAKSIVTPNLDRYFAGFFGYRINLDSKIDSSNFNPEVLLEVLQPKNYPLGRFPSNPDHFLSLMQQISVNLALNDKNNIRSVNGPPGTGKTTLLKDIFADLIVQQAKEICELSSREIGGSLIYWERAKLGVLPSRISDNNIIVASSNNGAVQNIVNELPRISEISDEFRESVLKANYFTTVANSMLDAKWTKNPDTDKNERELTAKIQEITNWGAFSLEGGASANVSKLLLNIEFITSYLKEEYMPAPTVYKDFMILYKELLNEREKVQIYYEKIRKLPILVKEIKKLEENYSLEEKERSEELEKVRKSKTGQSESLQKNIKATEDLIEGFSKESEEIKQSISEAQRNYEVIKSQKPSLLWLQKIFNKEKVDCYFKDLNNANEELNDLADKRKVVQDKITKGNYQIKKYEKDLDRLRKQIEKANFNFDKWEKDQKSKIRKIESEIEGLSRLKSQSDIVELDLSKPYEELQKTNPWFTKEFCIKQSELFIKALQVRKQFLYDNRKHLDAARRIWGKQNQYLSKENGQQLLLESWQWLNFTVPVISTTFASFGRMFKNLQENSIGNLFIDEAGQALPQASVGAIFRSKKVMVVGDPSQIKPVLTLDSSVLNLLGQHYRVNEKFVSSEASTQTIVDATSQYGFQKNEDEWIGIPLWVHRRSNFPMFTISNEISYNGYMVQGKDYENAQGKAQWFDISGKASNKFVKEQAEYLKIKIREKLEEDPELLDNIYVISPFKNVAYRVAKELDSIQFTKREKGKPTNVGTVHTFQGKEAKIVYFVLGADMNSRGSARWAVTEPNIMNVAATRAKEEFYIIGDKKLYADLGSKVANTTISIIDEYNQSC